MTAKIKTPLGIIEGFYGKYYPHSVRQFLMKKASSYGYSFYIYAPKNDSQLRSGWSKEPSRGFTDDLLKISRTACANSLDFGFGISPLNLTSSWPDNREVFFERVVKLAYVTQAKIVAVLFDDVEVDSQTVGKMQNLIVREVYSRLPKCVKKLIFCPTFYTFDPILEKLFGKKPLTYFEDITKELPSNVEIFWTGNRVLSKDITRDDILLAQKELGDRIVLWDNYPVNDAKKLCGKLFTRPFAGRRGLDGFVRGHAVNPMNEGLLSSVALSSLPLIYKNYSQTEINKICDAEGASLLGKFYTDNKDIFLKLNDEGFDSLSKAEKNTLVAGEYRKNPAYYEFFDYLNGKYAFDPACLTS